MASAFGSSSLFNNILLQVTNEKLAQLKSRQDLMRAHFAPVLASVGGAPTPRSALTLLYDAVRDAPIKNMIRDEQTLLDTLRYFIAGMQRDPSISEQIVGVWVEKLKQEIEFGIRKCEYSYLYGSLLSEWLDAENKIQSSEPAAATPTPTVAPSKDKVLEELHALMFTPPSTPFDKSAFLAYLRDEVFNVADNANHQQVLEGLRQEIKNHFDVSTHEVHAHSLRSCIDGLCSEDYVASDKKTALRQLKENSEVLSEVASLLTNWVRHLHLWDWSAPNVKVNLELSRGLAGQWRGALSEDVITMLLLRYTGVEWASKFKSASLRLYDAMWKKAGSDGLDTPEIMARIYYMSINGFRNTNYRASLLSNLPDSMYEQKAKNPDEYVQLNSESDMAMCEDSGIMECESESRLDDIMPIRATLFSASAPAPAPQNFAHKRMAKRSVMPPQQPQQPPIDMRQSFLHVLSTEIKLSHTMHPEQPFVVVQSNYENFHASLFHEPLLAILEFFHVPKTWLDFFAKFLHTPLKDRIRLRGIPDSHVFGSFFGEIALFVLDFNINRSTGINLYRVLDQFWLWGNDLEKMTKAWRIVKELGTKLGLEVDDKKSGSIVTYAEEKLAQVASLTASEAGQRHHVRIPGPSPLPQGSVRWAYLELASSGRFTIDRAALKGFTDEMKGLLDKAAGSTLQYINVYNKYMEFFVRNFGKNALVFGDQHVEQIVDALHQIHEELFKSQAGNVVQALKTRAGAKLPSEIVDVWVYWPLERGGLGLVNPFLEIMALHHKYEETYNGKRAHADPSELEFTSLLLHDRNNYDAHVRVLEERNKRRAGAPGFIAEKIPTFEEFVELRESAANFGHWYQRYVKLLDRPTPLEPPTITRGGPSAEAYYGVMLDDQVGPDAKHMQWIYTYYEPQLVRHFGSVQFINTELLPMSMIGNIRKSKVKH